MLSVQIWSDNRVLVLYFSLLILLFLCLALLFLVICCRFNFFQIIILIKAFWPLLLKNFLKFFLEKRIFNHLQYQFFNISPLLWWGFVPEKRTLHFPKIRRLKDLLLNSLQISCIFSSISLFVYFLIKIKFDWNILFVGIWVCEKLLFLCSWLNYVIWGISHNFPKLLFP